MAQKHNLHPNYKNHPNLSVARQCELLSINRSSIYYDPKKENVLNKKLKELILEEYKKYPYTGVPRMLMWLRKDKVFSVNKKIIERLYKELN